MNLDLLQKNFEDLKAGPDAFARNFYDRMLSTYPQIKPLFADTDFPEQRKKLIQSLASIVSLASNPEGFGTYLDKLGRSHNNYGVIARHYSYVTASLLASLKETLGDDWTEEAASSWDAALDLVSQQMINAQAVQCQSKRFNKEEI
jgi:hemoglobin-like flavoprotein